MTFISGTIGHAKPKREVFDFIEQKMDLDQTKTVYIGDNFEKDIIGAKEAGWQAIWDESS
ncbi:HAD family hydrolase [Bacillus sp. JJ1562]|uniref:HAD family hydrolase n=1 Tax=Bacillus sp. JJ1562 TaxID=3122960 RepID=UPI0030012263